MGYPMTTRNAEVVVAVAEDAPTPAKAAKALGC